MKMSINLKKKIELNLKLIAVQSIRTTDFINSSHSIHPSISTVLRESSITTTIKK